MTQFQTRYEEIMISEGFLSKTLGAAGLAGALALGGMQANKIHQDLTHKPEVRHNVSTSSKQAIKQSVPVKQQTKQAIPAIAKDNSFAANAAEVIKKYENNKSYPSGGYNASKGKWYPHRSLEGGSATIAYGHKLLPGEKFSNGLTDPEAIDLLKQDINKKGHIATSKMPKFETFPSYIKTAIINAMYRGDMGPNTVKLINAGQWDKAADEYLNHQEYKNTKLQGVKTRMANNASAFKKYAAEHN